MRISTAIFGILSLVLGGVCIYAGLGGYLNLRSVLVGVLVVLAVTIAAAALIPQKRRNQDAAGIADFPATDEINSNPAADVAGN